MNPIPSRADLFITILSGLMANPALFRTDPAGIVSAANVNPIATALALADRAHRVYVGIQAEETLAQEGGLHRV